MSRSELQVRPADVAVVGGSVYAEAVGDGRPVVVFEAGMATSRHMWGGVAAELADEFTCVLYDRRGLGRSPESDRPRDIAHMVEDLGAVVDAFSNGESVVLVGHSWGGPVIRSFAAEHAEAVRALVLVDQADETCPLYFSKGAQRQFRMTPKLLPALATFGLLKLVARRQSKAVPEPWASAMRSEDGTRTAARGQVAESVTVIDEITRLASDPPLLPEIPVAVISGGKVGLSEKKRRQPLIDSHRAMAAALPRGHHVVAERSSHLVPLTEPGIVADAVRRVVSESA